MTQKRSDHASACKAKINPGVGENRWPVGSGQSQGGFRTMALGMAFHHGRCLFVGGDVHFTRWPAYHLVSQPPGKLSDWLEFNLN